MGHAAKPIRHNRTLTVDFHDEATYFGLLAHTNAFVEFVFAFLLALGFQLLHKASCSEGGCLTRHSHYAPLPLRATPITRGFAWAGSPSGASSAPPAKRSSPSCRTLSCATARCGRT